MNEAQVREQAEEHGKSVERGDLAAVTSDFIPDLHPQVPEIAKSLPNPPVAAEVLSVRAADDHAMVQFRYTGSDRTVTVETRWEDHDGRPMIVAGAPLE